MEYTLIIPPDFELDEDDITHHVRNSRAHVKEFKEWKGGFAFLIECTLSEAMMLSARLCLSVEEGILKPF